MVSKSTTRASAPRGVRRPVVGPDIHDALGGGIIILDATM